jgi:hypothetical protein
MRYVITACSAAMLGMLVMVAPSSAQDAAPPGAPPPASPLPPAKAAATPTGPGPQVVVAPEDRLDPHQTCNDYAKSQHLKDQALAKAVSECESKLKQ